MSTFYKIGTGACGSVWALSDAGPPFKRGDGSKDRSLENDFHMHQRAIASFSRFRGLETPSHVDPRIRVPECHR
ncbi:hypothetical protein NUU61_008344 [Penicillium alfredii]|uniref:Uncharacterized protein n=1 Tax=Penicillium alfredii TaxID=1506179 RepID=A0A9W9ES69_9EURO|nr:uncharacterized protein NUU61_008344 [Penicillium alfredii]KAJ5087037.1 hypothetical protein NUU61_008344 [Penicillium alfredii]